LVAFAGGTDETPGEHGALIESPTKSGKYRFVQLYTSKSFESRRSELVNPPEDSTTVGGLRRASSSENLQEHVLSPRLVEAISRTTQVVWANTRKQEGLTGRSDIRLQTAVGMPVAVDSAGNMCIVVMFSPNNIQSSDEAMEYLQSLSQSATSSSIPCLLPVSIGNGSRDGGALFHPLPSPPSENSGAQPSANVLVPQNSLGEGVTARFVSLDDIKNTESHNHELSQAPKDTFGIPMLPSVAELGSGYSAGSVTPDEVMDVFDEASYGIWNTVMDDFFRGMANDDYSEGGVVSDPTLQVVLPDQNLITDARKERLEEFLSAFLNMSVFDIADVWAPAASNGYPECLRHVMSVVSSGMSNNESIREFERISEHALIKFWTGAIGRAYSSGNPVWSCNPSVFVDAGRALAYETTGIQTVLAVPVFSAKQSLPACVVSCYSLVKSNSVPFVLRFVQQALRLLWEGLDQFEPQNRSVKDNYWRNVNPADLGEMAADLEMQQHFVARKRPHNLIAGGPSEDERNPVFNYQDSLGQTSDLMSRSTHSVLFPDGDVITIPLELTDGDLDHDQSQRNPSDGKADVDVGIVHEYLAQAVRSVQDAVPFSDHVSTTADDSKRSHVMPMLSSTNSQPPLGPINTPGNTFAPLPMPRPFPSRVVKANVVSLNGSNHSSDSFGSAKNVTSQPSPHSQQLPMDRIGSSPEVLKNGTGPNQQFSQDPALLSGGLVQLASYAMAQHQEQEKLFERQIQQTSFSDPDHMLGLTSKLITTTCTTGVSSPSDDYFCQLVDSSMSLASMSTCRIIGCTSPALSRRPYCETHSGNRICEADGCNKCAQGCTRFCIAHGGGRRCTFPGCDKGARDKFFCAAHGGGKRCRYEGCTKSAVGGSDLCTAHGGGRRCEVEGCDKSAQSSTRFCVKHGGGKKCAQEGCDKVARGRTNFCAAHGGGVRCKLEGCNRVAIGKLQLCRSHGGSSSRARKDRSGQHSPGFDEERIYSSPSSYDSLRGTSEPPSVEYTATV
jgi:hypothetical protein